MRAAAPLTLAVIVAGVQGQGAQSARLIFDAAASFLTGCCTWCPPRLLPSLVLLAAVLLFSSLWPPRSLGWAPCCALNVSAAPVAAIYRLTAATWSPACSELEERLRHPPRIYPSPGQSQQEPVARQRRLEERRSDSVHRRCHRLLLGRGDR